MRVVLWAAKWTNEKKGGSMDELISRRAAIDGLKEAFNPSITNFVKAKMVIDNLPSAQPEPHWIPCSERLPEEEQTVLVTCTDGQVYIYDRLEACDYEYDDMRFWEDNVGCYQPREDVIAWMPLPEPYGERRTDEAD